MRAFRRFAAASIVAALALQAIYFGWSLSFQPLKPSEGPPRDALIVYAGGPGRLAAGMAWVKQGYAPILVYSDFPSAFAWATPALFKKQGVDRVFLVPARTTTDNARYCMALAKAQGWRRVILVTDWYHLPRARLATWIYALGAGVSVEAVSSGAVPATWYRTGVFWLEWIKFWGSFARMAAP